MSDDNPSSFDELAHEHNLSGRWKDLCRIFFKAGVVIGRRQAEAMPKAKPKAREYHHVLDRDTTPGEFR